jgi:hypothetical protein
VGNWKRIWIADYSNIEFMREKLGSKHGIDIDDFVLHTKVNKNLMGEEQYSREHGLRTVIRIRVSNGRRVQAFITLQDESFNIWSIRSARYLD